MGFRIATGKVAFLVAVGGGWFIPTLAYPQSAGQWKDSQQVFNKVCAHCHDSTRAARQAGQELRGRGLSTKRIIGVVRSGENSMPGFPESHISARELDDLATMIAGSPPPISRISTHGEVQR